MTRSVTVRRRHDPPHEPLSSSPAPHPACDPTPRRLPARDPPTCSQPREGGDGTGQADPVVMRHELRDDPSFILQAKRGLDPAAPVPCRPGLGIDSETGSPSSRPPALDFQRYIFPSASMTA